MAGPILERRDVVRALLRAIATRRFVILAGLSGTGKTQIARRIASAITEIDGVLGPGTGMPRVRTALEDTAAGKSSSLFEPAPGHPDHVRVLDVGPELGDGLAYTRRVGFLPVRPDWNDSRAVWGHYNPLTGHYYPTDALIVALNAYRDFLWHGERAGHYFLILDEMNLARVEYYFSDLLSLMEAGCSIDPDDPQRIRIGETARVHPVDTMLVSQGRRGVRHEQSGEARSDALDQTVPLFELLESRWLYEPLVHGHRLARRPDDAPEVFDESRDAVASTFPVPPRIAITPNLTLIGTVNVDETTYGFAPKVLDRAFVLEFLDVDYAAAFSDRPGWAAAEPLLTALHDALRPHGRHFGYRVAQEILDYVEGADGVLDVEVGDFLVMGKVLPKLQGTEAELGEAVAALLEIVDALGYPRSRARLVRMRDELARSGFASFF